MEIIKEDIINALNELPSDRLGEVFDYVLFIKQRSQTQLPWSSMPLVKVIPADHLDGLVGLVSWGGDALVDTEKLYEE